MNKYVVRSKQYKKHTKNQTIIPDRTATKRQKVSSFHVWLRAVKTSFAVFEEISFLARTGRGSNFNVKLGNALDITGNETFIAHLQVAFSVCSDTFSASRPLVMWLQMRSFQFFSPSGRKLKLNVSQVKFTHEQLVPRFSGVPRTCTFTFRTMKTKWSHSTDIFQKEDEFCFQRLFS